jgi:hypothetical protein
VIPWGQLPKRSVNRIHSLSELCTQSSNIIGQHFVFSVIVFSFLSIPKAYALPGFKKQTCTFVEATKVPWEMGTF